MVPVVLVQGTGHFETGFANPAMVTSYSAVDSPVHIEVGWPSKPLSTVIA